MSKHSGVITFLMLLGLILGAIVGQYVLHDPAAPIGDDHWTRQIGTLVLVRPLMLLIIPLVFVSVALGVASIGDPSRLGLVGGATLMFYLATTAASASLGAGLMMTFRPGDLPPEQRAMLTGEAESQLAASADAARIEAARTSDQGTLSGAWMDLVHQFVPTNIVKEAAEGKTLGVIMFAIVFGLALAVGGPTTRPAVTLLEALNDAIIRIVGWVMWLAPIGVFLLVSWTVGKIGLDTLKGPMAGYMLLVISGLAFFGFVVLPIVLWILGRTNPYVFLYQMRRALLTAFGTASSAASLPITLEAAVNEGGCSKRATNFVVPLGATVNQNGTALWEATAVVFLCQLYGIPLAFSDVLIVMLTATLAAIGAAGIPAAGLVTMVIVIGAVNVSLAGRGQPTLPPSAMGVIIGVDRILDMCRTVINVWGDVVGAKIMTKLAPDDIEERENALA